MLDPRRLLLLVVFLLSPGLAWAGNLHEACKGNTACEMHARDADWQRPYVVNTPGNCEHSVGLGFLAPPMTCKAYVEDGTYVDQPAYQLNYALYGATATDTCWVALHKQLGTALAGWTRVPGTHYLVDCTSVATPAAPADGLLLAKVTIEANQIQTFTPLYVRLPLTASELLGWVTVGRPGIDDGAYYDHEVIQQACDQIRANAVNPDAPVRAQTLFFPAGRTYKIGKTVDCNLPNYTEVLAHGAQFIVNFDGLAFDLNSDGECTSGTGPGGTCKNPIFGLRWYGGTYTNVAPTRTASVMWKIYAIKGVTIQFTRVENFWTALDMALQDNLYVSFNDWVAAASGHGILERTGAVGMVEDPTSPTGVRPVTVSSIMFVQYNRIGGSGMQAALALHGSPWWEQVTISNNVIAGLMVNSISIHSGVAGVVRPTSGIVIRENHFEQGELGATYINLTRPTGAPYGFDGVIIEGNTFIGKAGGWIGIKAHTLSYALIQANRFAGALGDPMTIEVQFWGSLRRVTMCNNTESGQHTQLDLSHLEAGSSRQDLTICPEVDTPAGLLAQFTPLVGYNGHTFTADQPPTTLDMSAIFVQFPPRGQTPKGYWIMVFARDTASATATAGDNFVRLLRDPSSAGLVASSPYCSLEGAPNAVQRGCFGLVSADSNGDIALEYTTTGTLTLWIQVVAIAQ